MGGRKEIHSREQRNKDQRMRRRMQRELRVITVVEWGCSMRGGIRIGVRSFRKFPMGIFSSTAARRSVDQPTDFECRTHSHQPAYIEGLRTFGEHRNRRLFQARLRSPPRWPSYRTASSPLHGSRGWRTSPIDRMGAAVKLTSWGPASSPSGVFYFVLVLSPPFGHV